MMKMISKIFSIVILLLIVGCSMVEIDIAVTGTGNPVSHEENNDSGVE